MSKLHDSPITEATWASLVNANQRAVSEGWAAPGVFATGVGPEYGPGGLLYVGKSAGPLGDQVGSGHDQLAGLEASRSWMIERRNKSAFWQMVDQFDRTRRRIAWTNVCKMDIRGGGKPPSTRQWQSISGVCMAALTEEIFSLNPKVALFATSDYAAQQIHVTLNNIGFARQPLDFDGGYTSIYESSTGNFAICTKHPQGRKSEDRDRVVALVRQLLP